MKRKNIILFGAGGHALSVIDVIEKNKKYKILFILDNFSGVIISENTPNSLILLAINLVTWEPKSMIITLSFRNFIYFFDKFSISIFNLSLWSHNLIHKDFNFLFSSLLFL